LNTGVIRTTDRKVRTAVLAVVAVLVLVPAVTRAFDRAGTSSTVRAGFSFKRSVDRPPEKLSISLDAIATPRVAPIQLDDRSPRRLPITTVHLSPACLYISTPGPFRAPPQAAA